MEPQKSKEQAKIDVDYNGIVEYQGKRVKDTREHKDRSESDIHTKSIEDYITFI